MALEDREDPEEEAAAIAANRPWVNLVASDRKAIQTVHHEPFGSVRPEPLG